ncbi:MAG: PrsW family glutamic-type intramembrane protease [Cyanobacteria bacterium J06639_18]
MSNGLLRLISGESDTLEQTCSYLLSDNSETLVGREPTCQIVFKSEEYAMVSRRHAAIAPSFSPEGKICFTICDLNSSNGTYLNGRRLTGCQELQVGDRIIFGNNGPEFVFEYEGDLPNTEASLYPKSVRNFAKPGSFVYFEKNSDHIEKDLDAASLSQLIPILSTGKDLRHKAYLIPGIITVIVVVLMFAAQGSTSFFVILAIYLAGAGFYFIYRLCGKKKPWWVLLASTLCCIVILVTPLSIPFFYIFRAILPGDISFLRTGENNIGFLEFFIRMFFGAGLLEEFLKSIPIFAFYFLGRILTSPQNKRVGVWEPLDGILIGSASAVGFTLFETLLDYVPRTLASRGALAGLQLLIPRILGEVAGHMAYSGYFGYFIGLSVLKPGNAKRTLAIGYFTASTIHALWNSMTYFGSLGILLLVLIGITSYAFLAAAILKARALSPSRRDNFATRLKLEE